jgi:hypothetical protein
MQATRSSLCILMSLLCLMMVTTLHADEGDILWDHSYGGSDLPSGIYLVRLTTGGYFGTQKMVLLE